MPAVPQKARPHWQLVHVKPEANEKHALSGENIMVGRDRTCSVVLSHPAVSRRHAKITLSGTTGLTKSTSLDGRAYDIACGQIDIGNAATEMTERMTEGVLQANGTTAPEPRMDVEHVAQAVVYMAGLPLESNVQFLTVMATKMPFIGRG